MRLIARPRHLAAVERLPRQSPVVALLGARQVRKTTLARQLVQRRARRSTFFDLEDPRDLAQLEEPTLALEGPRGLVVLDEIHRRLAALAPVRR
ncbi:MAG: AAA family ATPase [Candidatus Latescibacterota bacterium]